ncbi:hypothetical protein FE257_003321 [Aspergillus nanangensis]|uniref:Amidase domain-containing protein n=1 Tax=Aspergillus nanangensis TaxID=2582783 RepID=A0AAD4GWG8_ASPNN|nr:hypothetical protein FE257_003321 [Aspergillus nanangensis]
MSELNIVEATIAELQNALSSGKTNSVQLTAQHLNRIAYYDRRRTLLNAVPIIRETAFEDGQSSDDRRAAGASIGPLDGIPCTIKDSYKLKGMTVASGSPAFRSLIANEDAFTVQKIREAGGVILGRTNMPPMAAGGMQRGVYGRAESPYNKEYLTAAFASGSSNGSGTATAASFGVFGMGEETISSGRSPASNNGLVAYTPSRGLISIRGNWPLFPVCDTVVPHTRSIEDMFSLLDVIVAEDGVRSGDFWRGQPFVSLPRVDSVRPRSYHDLADAEALHGKRIGIPKMYIGGHDPDVFPVHTRGSVIALWKTARSVLESLGATVEEVEFPLVTEFEGRPDPGVNHASPVHRNNVDMCRLMAYAWDDFLIDNHDTTTAMSLATVDPGQIFPQPKGALRDRYDKEDPLISYPAVVAMVADGRVPIYEVPHLGDALNDLEARRKSTFEDWLDQKRLDLVVWPCNGDVGRADADVNEESAQDAWQNGVLYSNGNCAIRQLGVPTVNIPMGVMSDTQMPVNLTFAAKAYHDNDLFRYAYAYATASKARQPPGLTPPLPTDSIPVEAKATELGKNVPILTASGRRDDSAGLILRGSIDAESASGLACLSVYVDGEEVRQVGITDGVWNATTGDLSRWGGNPDERGEPDNELAMVVVVATANNGRSTGKLLFL